MDFHSRYFTSGTAGKFAELKLCFLPDLFSTFNNGLYDIIKIQKSKFTNFLFCEFDYSEPGHIIKFRIFLPSRLVVDAKYYGQARQQSLNLPHAVWLYSLRIMTIMDLLAREYSSMSSQATLLLASGIWRLNVFSFHCKFVLPVWRDLKKVWTDLSLFVTICSINF